MRATMKTTTRWVMTALLASVASISGCGGDPGEGDLDEDVVADGDDTGDGTDTTAAAVAGDPLQPIGTLSAGEASGVVASRKYPGVLWWHRDGGPTNGQPRNAVFAYRLENGVLTAFSPGVFFKAFTIAGQQNSQWEDIATDDAGNLWIGQIGQCKACPHYLLKVAEPDPFTATTAKVLARYPYEYPGAFKNAEGLLVVDGSPYIFSKESNTSVYRMSTFRTSEDDPNTLSLVGALAGPAGNISGVDISGDRRRMVIQTHKRVWVHDVPATALTGEAFVKHAIASPPTWDVDMSATALNIEGAAFVRSTNNVTLVAENKAIYYLPASFYETQ